jgi:hypothetical protein
VSSSLSRDVLPFFVATAIGLTCALVTAGSRARRALGIVMASGALATPYLVPAAHPIVRTALAILVFVGIMRVVDLRSVDWDAAMRLKHVLLAVDSRKIERTAPGFDAASIATAAAWAPLAVVCMWLVVRVAPETPPTPLRWLFRWACGLGFIYTLTEAVYALIVASYRGLGLATPTLHRHPAAARSVQEFWGRRWNRTVSAWLGETFFRPFARRGRPWLGLVVAFVVSAVAHAYIAVVAAGVVMAGIMLSFFLLQGFVIVLELVLGTAKWRAPAAHAWCIAWMVGASPLFTEPFLRMLGV